MRLRPAIGSLGVLAVFASCSLSARPAQGQNVTTIPPQTVRYIGVRTGVGTDGDRAILYVQPMKGGSREELHMRMTQELVDYFTKLAPGQPIEVALQKVEGKLYVTTVRAASPKPGESEQDTAYVKESEVLKVKGKAVTVLTLTKFGLTWQVEIPKVRTKDGLLASPVLLAAIKAVKPGALVEIELETRKSSSSKLPVLKHILPWAPWRVGVFSVMAKKKIDDQTRTTVEIKSSGIPLLLVVPRNGHSDDRTIMRAIYRLKKGQLVEFKIRQEGLNQLIRKIRPAAAKPKAAPAR